MAEQINLTSPDQAKVGTSDYWVAALLLDRDAARVEIRLNSAKGLGRTISYSGSTATAMMKALNTANLSVKSLDKRILERLIADGFLTGIISGAAG